MKQITYEIDIETLNSQKNVEQLDKEISNLVDGINELNETNNIQKKELQALEEKYKSLPKTALQARKVLMKDINMLRTAIKENNNALEGFRIKKQQLGKLKSDLKKSEKYFTDTTDQVFKFAKSIGSATAGLILLGGGSEETAKKFEKAGGVLLAFSGVLDSIKSGYKVFNNIIKTSTFLQKANNTINLTAATIMKAFGGSVNTTSLAFKGLRSAIIATGIGALVVLVGEIVANFDKIKESVSGVSKATENLVTSTQQRADLAEENLTTLQNQENILKLQGKTEREILQMKIDAQKDVITGIEANIAATKLENQERIEGSRRNKELLVKTAEILFIIPRTLIKGIDLLGQGLGTIINKVTQNKFAQKLFGLEPVNIDLGFSEDIDNFIDFAASIVFDPDEEQKKADKQMKILEENLLKQKNALAGFQLGLIDMDAKAAEVINKNKSKDRKKDTKETKEKINDDLQDYLDFLQAKEDLENQYFDSLLSKQDLEENRVADKYFALIEQAKIYGEDTTILEEARQHELDKIREKFAEKERQDRLSRINEDIELTQRGLEAVQALGDAVFAHKMKNLDKESKEGQKVAEKQFKFNKALQLGLAVVDGAKAVTASLAQAPVAIGAVPNPAGIASLAFAITTSAAQIATIAAQKFQPSLSSATSPSASSPSGGVSESQAPQFNIVGDSAFNQIAGALNQPIQAYVVAQDVTTAQQLDNGIITSATLGGG